MQAFADCLWRGFSIFIYCDLLTKSSFFYYIVTRIRTRDYMVLILFSLNQVVKIIDISLVEKIELNVFNWICKKKCTNAFLNDGNSSTCFKFKLPITWITALLTALQSLFIKGLHFKVLKPRVKLQFRIAFPRKPHFK